MFRLEINTSNVAFGSSRHEEHEEVKRILKNVIEQMEAGYGGCSIMDDNGNKVGKWSLD